MVQISDFNNQFSLNQFLPVTQFMCSDREYNKVEVVLNDRNTLRFTDHCYPSQAFSAAGSCTFQVVPNSEQGLAYLTMITIYFFQ